MTERNEKGKFIDGHSAWNKGKPLSDEHKRKIGQSNKEKLKIKIPKEELIRLYLKEKLSTTKIAALYGISLFTTLARMDEYGIKRRSISEANKGKVRSKETREKQSKIFKGRHFSPSTEFKRGHPAFSIPTREIINKAIEVNRKFFLSMDKLSYLYTTEKLSTNEIAKKLDVTGRTVAIWLEKYGIPIRTYSQSSRLLWKNPDFSNEHKANLRKSRMKQIIPYEYTKIERIIENVIQKLDTPYVHSFNLGDKFLCDFAIPTSKLLIECDGDYWHSLPNNVRRDKSKDAYARKSGWKILRLPEHKILNNLMDCENLIIQNLEVN